MMTLQEIRKEMDYTEQRLTEAIIEFQRRTGGLIPDKVTITRLVGFGDYAVIPGKVKIEVTIGNE